MILHDLYLLARHRKLALPMLKDRLRIRAQIMQLVNHESTLRMAIGYHGWEIIGYSVIEFGQSLYLDVTAKHPDTNDEQTCRVRLNVAQPTPFAAKDLLALTSLTANALNMEEKMVTMRNAENAACATNG